MCGSGTLAIEACYKALNKSCNIPSQKKMVFGFEHLLDFNKNLWREIQDQVRLEKKQAPKLPIYAQDISSLYVKLAQENSIRAKVEKHLTFAQKSFFETPKPTPTGLIVSNLPYGSRISKEDDLTPFYKKLGDHLKKNYTDWKVCFLVG